MSFIIRAAQAADLGAFFAYLNDHLTDNGRDGTPLFQPMPRTASRFPAEKEAAFRDGMATPVGQPGWRRLWLAVDTTGRFAGHIDLRARPEPAAAHRCLLGMGVDRNARRCGLGAELVAVAAAWARDEATLVWIDLEVLSVNAPARRLYARCGFIETGVIPDLFRIDDETLGYAYMSRKLD